MGLGYYDAHRELEDLRRAALKEKLNKVFKALRYEHKFGFARQKYLCCMSCGTQGVYNESQKREKEGKPAITKWAFYHEQDDERLSSGKVAIAFGDTVAEGLAIRAAALDAGLAVEWEGVIERRVRLMLPEVVEERVKKLEESIAEYQKRLDEGEAEEPQRVQGWLDMDVAALNSITVPVREVC